MHEIHKHCEPPVFDRKVTGGKLLQIKFVRKACLASTLFLTITLNP